MAEHPLSQAQHLEQLLPPLKQFLSLHLKAVCLPELAQTLRLEL